LAEMVNPFGVGLAAHKATLNPVGIAGSAAASGSIPTGLAARPRSATQSRRDWRQKLAEMVNPFGVGLAAHKATLNPIGIAGSAAASGSIP